MFVWDQTAFQRCYSDYSRSWWQSFKTPQDATQTWWRDVWNARIVPAIGTVQGAQRVLFVGCGLGLGVEVVIDSGFAPNTWGIDSSAYIQGLWPTQARADIRPKLGALDIRTVTSTQLRTLTGINNVRFNIIVTEDILSSYTDAELASTSATVNPLVACQNWLAAGGKIINLIWTMDGSSPDMTRWPSNAIDPTTGLPTSWAGQPVASPGSPPRTMAEWQALRGAPHQFVSTEGI